MALALRTKTLLVIGLVLLVLLSGMFCTSRATLRQRFSEIERDDAEQTAARTRAVLASMLEDLDEVTLQWSQSAQSPTPAALESLRLAAAALFDEHSEPLALMGWDAAAQAPTDFPPALLAYVTEK